VQISVIECNKKKKEDQDGLSIESRAPVNMIHRHAAIHTTLTDTSSYDRENQQSSWYTNLTWRSNTNFLQSRHSKSYSMTDGQTDI